MKSHFSRYAIRLSSKNQWGRFGKSNLPQQPARLGQPCSRVQAYGPILILVGYGVGTIHLSYAGGILSVILGPQGAKSNELLFRFIPESEPQRLQTAKHA